MSWNINEIRKVSAANKAPEENPAQKRQREQLAEEKKHNDAQKVKDAELEEEKQKIKEMVLKASHGGKNLLYYTSMSSTWVSKDLSRNNITSLKCFEVYSSQWMTSLGSRRATKLSSPS